MIFRQSLPPGHQGLSDFTVPNTPVTVAGEPFEHLLYQFRLAFSGWRAVTATLGGESYSALASGLQSALGKLGGSPSEHRTDSLSAAYVNLTEQRYLTENYQALCAHYAMCPTTNNLGVSHENGAIEASHGSLKQRFEPAIKLRGSADFPSRDAYRCFLQRIVDKLNQRCRERLTQGQGALWTLPGTGFIEHLELSVRVTRSSTISMERVLYTVPSQLVAERLRVYLYHDRLECYVGQTRARSMLRVYPERPQSRARRICYGHIIHSLAA